MSEQLEIEERNGAIIVKFPGDYIIMPPDQAREVAEVLAKYAYAAQYGSEPKTKSIMAEQIRAKLLNRVSLVIRSLQDKNKKPLYIANEVVNICLSEAL